MLTGVSSDLPRDMYPRLGVSAVHVDSTHISLPVGGQVRNLDRRTKSNVESCTYARETVRIARGSVHARLYYGDSSHAGNLAFVSMHLNLLT